ncbi:cupin domain-containing protein [Hyphobacterium sp. CCMP332]|nr:cupin domain-containing protein [Hyphobacterium sp. CCMP332]
MKKRTLITCLLALLTTNLLLAQSPTSKSDIDSEQKAIAEKIIKSFVKDYQEDRFAKEARVIGIEIPNAGQWTVNIKGLRENGKWLVNLKEGLPDTPCYAYSIEFETLNAIYENKINALTAQGKAFASDYTPMSVNEINGFKPNEDEDSKLNAFSFHFWTKGFPEIIPFREELTRQAHGSNFTIFYYEKGLRTAWYRILPGERVRDDAREQAAPFPMLAVTIKGTIDGEVDGKSVTISEGNTVFIPANSNHKWWNDREEAVEVILIMFGEGA